MTYPSVLPTSEHSPADLSGLLLAMAELCRQGQPVRFLAEAAGFRAELTVCPVTCGLNGTNGHTPGLNGSAPIAVPVPRLPPPNVSPLDAQVLMALGDRTLRSGDVARAMGHHKCPQSLAARLKRMKRSKLLGNDGDGYYAMELDRSSCPCGERTQP